MDEPPRAINCHCTWGTCDKFDFKNKILHTISVDTADHLTVSNEIYYQPSNITLVTLGINNWNLGQTLLIIVF